MMTPRPAPREPRPVRSHAEGPAHPKLAAALLMVGIVLLIILVSLAPLL